MAQKSKATNDLICIRVNNPLRIATVSGLLALNLMGAGCANNPAPPIAPASYYPPPEPVPEDEVGLNFNERRALRNPWLDSYLTPSQLQKVQARRFETAHRNEPSWGHDLAAAGIGAVSFEAGKKIFSGVKSATAVAAGGTVAGRALAAAPEAVAPAVPAVAEGTAAVEGAAAGAEAVEAVEAGEVLLEAGAVVGVGAVALEVGAAAAAVCLVVCW